MSGKAIAVGSDEAGFALKEAIKSVLEAEGHTVLDYGCHSPDPVDYPDVALAVAHRVAAGDHERAILVCGTGIGMAIAANKVPGVYATVAHDPYSAAKARSSNNAQILTLGARVVAPELAAALVRTWLGAEFGGGGSARKVAKIARAEQGPPEQALADGSSRGEMDAPGGARPAAVARPASDPAPPGTLKKVINDPFAVVDEGLDGFVAAHADIVAFAGPRVVVRRQPARDKVGLVIGGGSGHEPAFVGYVGAGLADAAACGNVFAAPSADVALQAIRAANHGRGVVVAYGRYAGDVLNFGLAAQLAEAEGIAVREIHVGDDVASAPREEAYRRRGIAGDVIVFKAAGAAAERGDSLDEVVRLSRAADAATRSMGIALSACEVPGAGRPTFAVPEGLMEVGMGVHGEPGVRRMPLATADEIAEILVEAIVADLGAAGGSEVALLVNGLGATATLDQYVLYRGARRALEARGMTVARSYVGEYITSLEMSGASITVTLLEPELRALLDAPARTVRIVQ